MSLRLRVLLAALAGCVCAAGASCGYAGQATLDQTIDPGVVPTNTREAGADATPPSDDADTNFDVAQPPGCPPPTCTLPTAPAGWELVLLGSARTDACPAGFDSADPVENPVAAPEACACAACVTSGTNCATGKIPTAFDNGGGACARAGADGETNAGNCFDQNGRFSLDARVDPPTAVVGTCTSVTVSDRAHVDVDARRVCTRQPATCSNAACGAAPSLEACIVAPGDVACPAGGPATKHLVGSDFTLACAACGCTINAATCGGELDFYPQTACAGTAVAKLTVGVCAAVGGANFQSTKWKPVVAKEDCTTTPATPTTTLSDARTICCP